MTPQPSPPSPPAHDPFDQIDNIDAILKASREGSSTEPAPEPAPPAETNPVESTQPVVAKGVLVHDPKANGRRMAAMLVPALLLMFVAFGLTVYRVSQPDWHWGPVSHQPRTAVPVPAPATEPAVAKTDEAVPPGLGLDLVPQEEPGKSAEVHVAQTETPPAPALESPLASSAENPEKPPAEIAGTAKPEQPLELSDIEQEAERVRAERKELEDHKREEGEKMAQEARRRPPAMPGFRGIDPRLFAGRNQAALEQFMRQQMAAQQQQFEAMLRAQGRFRGRQDFLGFGRGAGNANPDQAFELMRREMEAFEAEALRLMKPQDRAAVQPPAPAEADAEAEAQEPNADWPPRNRPQIRRFNYVDPRTGAKVQGFQMQFGTEAR